MMIKMVNETVNIKIGKMVCNMCITNVEEALTKINEINTFNVNLEKSNAIMNIIQIKPQQQI